MTILDPGVGELVERLEAEGARFWAEAGQLRFRAPRGVLTDERRRALRAEREAVLAYLDHRCDAGQVRPDPSARHEPFPLTEVQSAYLLGRRDAFAYGGVACHGYGEIPLPDVDPAVVQAAWQRLVRRHDMLRAVIAGDGTQRVLATVPEYEVTVLDLRGAEDARIDAAVDEIRAELSHRVYDPGRWPLFELRLTRTGGALTLHLSIDFLISDLVSTQLLFTELHRLVTEPGRPLPTVDITFRDYLLAEEATRTGPRYERDRAYWSGRCDDLPPAPELPVLDARGGGDGPVRFERYRTTVDARAWSGLRDRAGRHGVTASVAVLAAYAEVVARWSRQRRFTLDLTLQNRQPLHPQVNQLVGDFTAVGLLAVDRRPEHTVAAQAQALQAQLWADLDHRLYSGLRVARDVARRRGPGTGLFPIVYTSAIGVTGADGDQYRLADMGYGITQTPQVWIDCQALETSDALVVNWDVRTGVFPPGLVAEMFAAFARLLHDMAGDDSVWAGTDPVPLPDDQRRRREAVNATAAPVPTGRLQDALVARALRDPSRPAVVAGERALSYGDLLGRATAVAHALRAAGLRPGSFVAVAMDKGWEQVVGVLGVLQAGGGYLPLDTGQPPARRDQILADAGVRHVLVQPHLLDAAWPAGCRPIDVTSCAPVPVEAAPAPPADPEQLAYVIYTSGSSGVPKGVMISHRSALNTVEEINRRFGIGSSDRVLGLASLGFDLSVYDIFGVLGAGGLLVLPEPARRSDPSHWAELLARHGITLWNSVPAQLQMLADYLATGATPAATLSALRLALLSGDWIPVTLPERVWDLLPGVQLVSLGGATEAAIWSNYYPIEEVDPGWPSIPYGWPLANQTFQVFDEHLRPCPDLVVGELHIGGVGLAAGYLGDAAKTAERFIHHPVTGERWYRTGDLGRYRRDGSLELLGREDRQVKIRGHRIELAEVEHVLGMHPAVGGAAVIVDGDQPLSRRLVAFVEPAHHPGAPATVPDAVTAAAAGAAGELTGALDRERHAAYRRRLDAFALWAMNDALHRLGGLGGRPAALDDVLAPVAPRHHRLVRRWLRALAEHGLIDRTADGRYAGTVADGQLPFDARWAGVAELADGVEDPAVLAYYRVSLARLPELLTAVQDPLALLFPGGELDRSAAVFGGSVETRAANQAVAAAVAGIAAERPDRALRVLEVGAGTGATTEAVFGALGDREVEYLFTDVSPAFLAAARQRFSERPGLRFAAFDVDEQARAQELTPNAFDVVVAADVLHASVDIAAALRRLVWLLAPGGYLVASEMTRDHLPVLASLELLVRLDTETGDFRDRRQGRDQTFLSEPQWREELAAAGLTSVVWPARDDPTLYTAGLRVLVARAKTDRAPVAPAELGAHLASWLPAHMVPTQIQVVDALPLTGNAKIDHATLRSWIPANRSGRPESTAAAPAGDLEQRLAVRWADAFGVDRIGRDETFLDLGGDSLIAARLAGALREEVPEAAALFFDDLLRLILEGTSVAALAAALTGAPGGEAGAPVDQETCGVAGASRAGPAMRRLGGRGEPVRVLVHDDTLRRYRADLDSLTAAGEVLSLTVSDVDDYLRLDPAELVDRVVDEYAQALVAAGMTRLHLIGAGPAGVLAVEVARRVADAGVDVASLTVAPGEAVDGREPDDPAGAHTAHGVDGYRPSAYAGDVTLAWPASMPGREAALAFWREVCLGDVILSEEVVGA